MTYMTILQCLSLLMLGFIIGRLVTKMGSSHPETLRKKGIELRQFIKAAGLDSEYEIGIGLVARRRGSKDPIHLQEVIKELDKKFL